MEPSTLRHLEEVRQSKKEQKEDTARMQKKVEHSANPNGQVSTQGEGEIKRCTLDGALLSLKISPGFCC